MISQDTRPSVFTSVALFLFYAYAIAITLFTYFPASFLDETRGQLTPLLGWVPCSSYSYTLIFLFLEKRLIRKCRVNLFFMILALIFGLIDFYSKPDAPFGNLYLDHSPYRPIFTLGLPVLWIVLMSMCIYQLSRPKPANVPGGDIASPGTFSGSI